MKRIYRTPTFHSGFSLIEVMIAVVVLATGLLALAALQGSLARASGEAKVRGRVAALLSTRMEQLRANQYIGAATLANDSCATDLGAGVDWVPPSFCTEAGLGAITASQQVSTWSSAVGATTFTQGRVPDVGEPEFKRVTLTATWIDASNETHRLAMTSELSALALRDALLPPPPGAGTPTGQALVRTDSPVTAGVVPIAIGSGNATAASNPRPQVLSDRNQSVVGTKFEVITYQGLTGAAVIQRRIETQVIKCTCKYGAGGSNLPEIYRKAEWPAIWTGERYDVYAPSPVADAPGKAAASGVVTAVSQSDLCQECCRDHHDTAGGTVPKFDPERVITAGQAHAHYSTNNQGDLVVAPNTTNSQYDEACRVIRVDGFWRTAADLYSRHMGLLATEIVDGKPAKTGVPIIDAASAYQVFVKDYLTGYTGLVATAPANADFLFAQPARQLDEPASIDIKRPSPADERYLHGRGLYVDYLEKAARDKIKSARTKCPVGTAITECMLPYLPFTTINITELGFWEPQKLDATISNVISVATGSALIFDPLKPIRGRTNALASATNGDVAFSAIQIGRSNAGVAVTPGVDTDDEAFATDRQQFVVTALATPQDGDTFFVRLTGSDLVRVSNTDTLDDPSVVWGLVLTGGSRNCDATVKLNNPGQDFNPSDYVCNTDGTLGGAGSVLVGNYNKELPPVSANTSSSICTYNGIAQPATGRVAFPTFADLRVSSASMSLGGPNGSFVPGPNPSKATETTLVTFTSIPENAVATIGFTLENTVTATIASCTTDKNGNAITVTAWNKPWEAP